MKISRKSHSAAWFFCGLLFLSAIWNIITNQFLEIKENLLAPDILVCSTAALVLSVLVPVCIFIHTTEVQRFVDEYNGMVRFATGIGVRPTDSKRTKTWLTMALMEVLVQFPIMLNLKTETQVLRRVVQIAIFLVLAFWVAGLLRGFFHRHGIYWQDFIPLTPGIALVVSLSFLPADLPLAVGDIAALRRLVSNMMARITSPDGVIQTLLLTLVTDHSGPVIAALKHTLMAGAVQLAGANGGWGGKPSETSPEEHLPPGRHSSFEQ